MLFSTLGARQTADISYGDVALEYAEGFKNGEISYQDVLGERSDDAVSGEPREESYFNQTDDGNVSADQIVDASEDQTIGPEETLGQDEIDGRRPEQPRDGGRRYSSGGLAPLEGAPVIKGATGPDAAIVAVAEQYAADNGDDGSGSRAAGTEGGSDVGRRPAESTETLGQDEIDGRRPEQPRDGGRRYSSGGLSPLEAAPAKTAGPDPSLVTVAEDYAAANGIAFKGQAE